MGYDTHFTGEFAVVSPLSADEVSFLKRFADTRHCSHQPSPYVADGALSCRSRSGCVTAGPSVPGFWCKWEPSDDGAVIRWNGMEKFSDYVEWLSFLIEEFLKPNANVFHAMVPIVNDVSVTDAHIRMSPAGHSLSGVVEWQGEEPSDAGQIIVHENHIVTRRAAERTWGEFEEFIAPEGW